MSFQVLEGVFRGVKEKFKALKEVSFLGVGREGGADHGKFGVSLF